MLSSLQNLLASQGEGVGVQLKNWEYKIMVSRYKRLSSFFHTSPNADQVLFVVNMTNGRSQEIEAQARKGPFTDFKKAFPLTFFLNYFTFYHQNVNNSYVITMIRDPLSMCMYAQCSVIKL